jgi:Fe-S cluster assembly iron-binding protein IscA
VVSVTERAKKELKNLLSRKVDWPEARLRLMDRGEGIIGLGIDVEEPGDQVLEFEDKKVLICDHELAMRLKGITIDVDDTPEGAEIVICED